VVAFHGFLRGLRVRFLDRSRRPDYSPATCLTTNSGGPR
jgi:hypothetical protein